MPLSPPFRIQTGIMNQLKRAVVTGSSVFRATFHRLHHIELGGCAWKELGSILREMPLLGRRLEPNATASAESRAIIALRAEFSDTRKHR